MESIESKLFIINNGSGIRKPYNLLNLMTDLY